MNKYFKCILYMLLGTSCVHRTQNHHDPSFSETLKKTPLNRIVRDLSFFPINALRFRLSELKNKKAIAIVMRERNCPISEKYGPRLARMEKKYSKLGIQFIYNYVGLLDSTDNGRKDLERFGFKAPYIIDTKQTLVNALSVHTTGEVLILTPDRRLVYRGPLDDQYHLLRSALEAKNNYVSDILDIIVSGKKPVPKEIPAPGCVISRPVLKKKLFYRDVASIISNKCSICHNPSGSGFIDYVTYEDVFGNRGMFEYVIENDLMPPWGVDPLTGPWINDLSLTIKEKAMLLKWIEDGFPRMAEDSRPLWTERKREKAKEADSYTIHLPQKVEIPAEGLNELKYFIFSNPFTEDKWIRSVEFLSKPKVIHHMRLFIMDRSFIPDRENMSIVGKSSLVLFGSVGISNIYQTIKDGNNRKNVGEKLPAKTKMILEVHYESIGHRVVDDYTHIKINFHRQKPEYKTITYLFVDSKINISPHESNHQVNVSYKTKKIRQFVGVAPHMHLRGKASTLYVTTPERVKQRIFGIDPYLSNFQKLYELKKPLTIPKGSTLECINWFDNSTSNPVNPDPEKYVRWGNFLKDEMSTCPIRFLVPFESNEVSKVIESN